MTTNRAAWQDEPGLPLSIRSSPYPRRLTPSQIIVKPHAWAINPGDHVVQQTKLAYITYPVIPGEDIAGTVVLAGIAAMGRFKTHDRVLAVTPGAAIGKTEMGGFQEYVVVESSMACHIPDSISFGEAVVFPLCVAITSHGLFSRDFLALPYPKVGPVSTGKSILIWGGSSSVGCNAIQLAKAAGLDVISTCSPYNFDYLKKLGARKVFDYSSETVCQDVVAELDCGPCAGIFQAAGSVEACLEVALNTQANLLVVTSSPIPEGIIPGGVRARMIFGGMTDNEMGPAIFGDFLPKALELGKYKVAPKPLVMETTGLEGIQEGFEALRSGVSAKKVVVVADWISEVQVSTIS